MSGKGDWIPGTNDAAYSENYPTIDWTKREREAAADAEVERDVDALILRAVREIADEASAAELFHGIGQHATAIGIQCGVLGVISIDHEDKP